MSARVLVFPTAQLQGTVELEPDKSVALRALLLSAISQGTSTLTPIPTFRAFTSLQKALEGLGIEAQHQNGRLYIQGGLETLRQGGSAHLGNSATAARLLAGIGWTCVRPLTLQGSPQLQRRPMARILSPLRQMGAQFLHRDHRLPITFYPTADRRPLYYALPMASAQVKSCLLLAGLTAQVEVLLWEPFASRDHTERMLEHMGVPLRRGEGWIHLEPVAPLPAEHWQLWGDPSQGAYWLSAAALIPHTRLTLSSMYLNPTRLGFAKVLERMGVTVELLRQHHSGGEEVGSLQVHSPEYLVGTDILPEEVPSLIDEVPLLMVCALFAHGQTRLWGAKELRYKESDRLKVMTRELRKLGAYIEEHPDGFSITGPQKLKGGVETSSEGDHRIAMALAIAALRAEEPVAIERDVVAESYPSFWQTLKQLGGRVS